MAHYKYTVPLDLSCQRLDKTFSSLCSDFSRSQIQKAIKNSNALLNNEIISNLSVRVKENDVVEINIVEEIPENIEATSIELDIVYEDSDIIVINKSSDMTVHPGAGNQNHTLVNALIYHGKKLSDIGFEETRPGIIHRLDKNTSGLMIVAKNNKAHVNLAKQIETRNLIRKYKALVWGMIKQTEGIIDIPIGRNNSDRTKMKALNNGGGKEAITNYKVIEILHKGLFSLVECKLETGRTHQIRVHMSHIGHSIVGDQTYGNNLRKIHGSPEYLRDELLKMNHQALHSFFISFNHPITEKKMEFEQPIPSDYNQLLNFINSLN
jgi:23S rRNA pseudouridine1911/1915/1917 synthase